MQEVSTVWEDCLNILKDRIQPQSFKTWLKPTRLINDNGHELNISVPNRFVANWLEGHYVDQIQEAVSAIFGQNKAIKFTVASEEAEILIPEPIRREPPKSDTYAKTLLNRRYTFESFVVGDSNQFAHAAALAVAEAPSSNKFNPFYIYGGVGLGKTHLAQAIGNFVAQANSSLSVLYVTSEKFTNDFINAISTQKTADFANHYRNIDVLMIDDIQFLTGKEATQIQFFHTFNALHQSGRQIVMTSDRPPHEIHGLEERLLSRFQCGLVGDIQPPDFEMRLAILNKRIETEKLDISADVASFIADNVRSNIRELDGFLIRLSAYYSLTGRKVTTELVSELLGKRANGRPREMTLEDIQKTVADYFKIAPDQLRGKGKTSEVANARQIAMYISRNNTTYSLKTIGDYFGGRDHSTVIHSITKVSQSLSTDSLLKFRVEEIIKKLRMN
jgi:chromosomal replication initiator protein